MPFASLISYTESGDWRSQKTLGPVKRGFPDPDVCTAASNLDLQLDTKRGNTDRSDGRKSLWTAVGLRWTPWCCQPTPVPCGPNLRLVLNPALVKSPQARAGASRLYDVASESERRAARNRL